MPPPPHPPATCGNPILLGFLKEWYDAAKEQNSKGASTYKRAHDSMKACPITFSHPSEASALSGIGPKLCERLTKSLEDFCELKGLPKPKKARGAHKRATATALNDHAAEAAAASLPKRRKTVQRAYVPAYRSGAYALLIALHAVDEATRGELVDAAREHCDASFDAPADTTKFYTAWNSMRTLMEKNLVYARGNPKRYCLTDSGLEVAEGIVRARGTGVAGVAEKVRKEAAGRGRDRGESYDVDLDTLENQEEAVVVEEEEEEGEEEEEEGTEPRRRATHMPVFTMFGRNEKDDDDDDEPDTRTVVQKRADIEARRKRLQMMYASGAAGEYGLSRTSPSPGALVAIERGAENARQRVLNGGRISRERPAEPAKKTTTLGACSTTGGAGVGTSSQPAVSGSSSRATTTVTTTRTTTTTSSITTTTIATSTPIFPHFTPTVLLAGTYTVELILDTREVRSKTDRDYLQNNLIASGITPSTRPLSVGDALWVARTTTGSEYVLDFIVERKRLDDLISSLKDGRFHEQKFRLTKSGIANVIYIIEDITINAGSMQEAVDTAISSTQVVNGFFVKRTAKLDDTIQYLARLTRRLQEVVYSGKDLYLVPDALVDSRTYPQLREHMKEAYPGREFYLKYDTFSSLMDKSASTTLRDLFLKMLMCVRGVSVEKALEIQKAFRTPNDLVVALEGCAGEKEREELVMRACSGAIGRRKIGAALSQKVAEVWWGKDGGGGEQCE